MMLNNIDYRSLKRWKYELMEELSVKTNIRLKKAIKTEFITLMPGGVLTISKYYAWDGATCAIDTKSFIRGSLVHDALIQLINDDLLEWRFRKDADEMLHQIVLEDGMWKFRAWYVYKAVRLHAKLQRIDEWVFT